MSTTPDRPTVEKGQVWADNDKRGYGRHLRVVELTETHAVVEQVSARDKSPHPATIGRRTRIRLDRFKPTSTGYRLVQLADGTAPAAGPVRPHTA